MNDAHLHLIVNHFPIIGSIFGIAILIAGLIFKKRSIEDVAYSLFIVSAVFAAVSMSSGEGAEEIVEKLPNIDKHLMHDHEEYAEKFSFALYALGFVSIVGLYTNIKNRGKAKMIQYLALAIALIAVYFAKNTGFSGGEIRHAEIINAPVSSEIEHNEAEED